MIVRVSVVLRRTVCDDIHCPFENLSGSHLIVMMTSVQVVETSVNITIDTTLNRTIMPHRLMISLLGSNYLQFHVLESVRSNVLLFLIRTHHAGQKSREQVASKLPSPPYNFEPVYSEDF